MGNQQATNLEDISNLAENFIELRLPLLNVQEKKSINLFFKTRRLGNILT